MTIFSRISPASIFKRHLQTFYHYGRYQYQGEKKVPFSDVFTFVFVPLAFAAAIVWLEPDFVVNSGDLIITSLSIFVGLLFSLLTMIFDLAKKEKEIRRISGESYIHAASFTLIKELFVNVASAIALSIVCVIMIFVSKFRPQQLIEVLKKHNDYTIIKDGLPFVIYTIVVFLLIEFLLTLLMILKRFFLIFNKQIESD